MKPVEGIGEGRRKRWPHGSIDATAEGTRARGSYEPDSWRYLQAHRGGISELRRIRGRVREGDYVPPNEVVDVMGCQVRL